MSPIIVILQQGISVPEGRLTLAVSLSLDRDIPYNPPATTE